MRWLLLSDLVVTALISAILLSSPTTFAYYRLGWLAHAGIALLVWILARRRAYWFLLGLSGLTLSGALLLLPPHFGALDLLLILWTLGALPLISAALVGRQLPPHHFQLPRALLLIVIAAGCIVSLRSVRDFPNFSATDEAMIFNYIDTFERTGKVETSLIPYPAAIVTGNLYTVAAALWTRVFPNDPFTLRNFSELGGLLLIVVAYLVGRALRDTLTGWLAAGLLSTNLLWLGVAHVGRQEIWLTVFVWTAVWLSLEARKRHSGRIALLAGVTVALSADVHPLGVLACLALGGWWISQMKSTTEHRTLFAFIIGGLIGTAYYAAVHILPDPAYFLSGVRDELVSYGAEGSTPLSAMLARHANYLQSNPLEIGLLLICGLWALRQRNARLLGVFVSGLMLL
ncbi:MAG: hypothetical protein GC204_17760, partial [Chloroflexi bacterium]|nr:hypothetical protein [Chloroflexota bacterium]